MSPKEWERMTGKQDRLPVTIRVAFVLAMTLGGLGIAGMIWALYLILNS